MYPRDSAREPDTSVHSRSDDAAPTVPLLNQTYREPRLASSYLRYDDELPRTHRRLPRQRQLLIAGSIALLVVLLLTTILVLGRAFGSPQSGVHHAATPSASSVATQRATASPSSGQPAMIQLPPGIPQHFSFGIMNSPGDTSVLDGMRAHNGTAWDFRYQYLAGGVNTGKGWETWNSPSGQFAMNYMRESADHHYTPALVYYDMLQSHGSCDDCAERNRDLSNLSNPAVMSAYYANWRLLMQMAGAYGRPVLIVVEPDLWGYMQGSVLAKDNSPADVPASVASSGDPDATAFPNNGQGYAWALLHIRDRYAPNAILALHMSNWAAGEDIDTSTDSSLDVQGTAKRLAQFLMAAGLTGTPRGVSTWDLLSNDVADHDSGQGAAWWDRTNHSFPNFARDLTFISDVTHLTGKRVMMWQVPEGNQYFDTENNSNHHTQDNRAEYIVGHVADFARAGIVGVLFGPGNGGTSIDDAANDGVTNPAPISDFQCDHCNNHVSIYPDDDGGYLRIFVGAYYAHGALQLANPGAWTPAPPPHPGATATPPPPGACISRPEAEVGSTRVSPNPAAAGQAVSVLTSITLSCDTSVLIDIEVYYPGKRILQATLDSVSFRQGVAKTVSVPATIPGGTPPGSYIVKVGVFPVGWGPYYAWDDNAATLLIK